MAVEPADPFSDGIQTLTVITSYSIHYTKLYDKFTPIMMLTTESDQAKMMAGKAAGAKAWLVKPFQPPALLEAVSKLVLP